MTVEDEDARSERATVPIPLSLGDRVTLEQQIKTLASNHNDLKARVLAELAARTRRDGRIRALVYFSLGMATASLAVQIVRIVALILLHDGL